MDKKKYYIIPAKEAEIWYEGYLRWLALDGGGVDNWEGYGESLYSFREACWIMAHPNEEFKRHYKYSDIVHEDLNKYNTMEM